MTASSMRLGVCTVSLALTALSGCGENLGPVADACKTEIMRKGEGQNITVDAKQLLSGITKQPDGTYLVSGHAALNSGTNAEKDVPLSCIIQVGEGAPTVIRAEFDYSGL
jgi:hypothetical protein